MMSRSGWTRMLTATAVVVGAIALWAGGFGAALPQQDELDVSARLTPTAHPPVPLELDSMWLAPAQGSRGGAVPGMANFVKGIALLEESDDAARALPLLSAGVLAGTPVADYARYYTGLALQELKRYDEAEAAFAAVAARNIEGHLPEDAALRQAEVRADRGDHAGAVALYEELLEGRISAPHVAWLGLAAAAEASDQLGKAIDAYRRVYYDYPLSREGDEAERALVRLKAVGPDTDALVARERTRADLLFANRRWRDAQSAYERLEPRLSGADRRRATIRVAACDVQLGRSRDGLAALEPHISGGPHAAEARLYHLMATRRAGRRDAYVAAAHRFVDDFSGTSLAGEALDALGTHHIIVDEDAEAAAAFRRILTEYPNEPVAERAAWKAGWWAYRHDEYADAIRFFEQGSASFPRSDYRPEWLYWSARAYDESGNRAAAIGRYTLTVADYQNIYYGRLASARLETLDAPPVTPRIAHAAPDGEPPPTTGIITTLVSVGLYQEALNELRYAERVWGGSPQVTATIALVYNRMGRLRPGINAMKRAYPQYMAAGGERLPDAIQRVLFPLDYWPLIQKTARTRDLDPYLVAALIAQESTFDPVIRSSANAIGLMQLLPSTGKIWGRRIGIRRYSTARLTEPEVNILIGTAYFRELVREFGGAHFALAGYNAGENAVRRWRRERPGLPQEEFIDDIPYPETQNYVKRILGTAYDYRRLYGPEASVSGR